MQSVCLLQVDVIKGKQGENRLVITLNGKVSHNLPAECLILHCSAVHIWSMSKESECCHLLTNEPSATQLAFCLLRKPFLTLSTSMCCCCSFCHTLSRFLMTTLPSLQSKQVYQSSCLRTARNQHPATSLCLHEQCWNQLMLAMDVLECAVKIAVRLSQKSPYDQTNSRLAV